MRNLQYIIEAEDCQWARQMQTLLRRAIHVHNLRETLSAKRFDLFAQACGWKLNQLLAMEPPSEDGQRLWQRFHKHRSALLLFLECDDVLPTNNASEQALHNNVIYRKVTGGFRMPWGATLYTNLLSILETVRRQARSRFDILTSVFTSHPQFSWIRE